MSARAPGRESRETDATLNVVDAFVRADDCSDLFRADACADSCADGVLVLVRLRHLCAERLADRAADRRADDGVDLSRADAGADDSADFLGADGSADGGLYACADGVLVLIRLRHTGADRAAFVRAVAVTDAGAVGSAVGRRSGDKAARTDTYLPSL